MLAWSPLSPERAQASFTSGTLVSPVAVSLPLVSGRPATSRGVPTGTPTSVGVPSRSTVAVTSTFGTRVENRRMRGIGLGRPPTSPDRPGAMPVAAWAISRANRPSALRSSCRAAIFTTTSRLSSRRAWAP